MNVHLLTLFAGLFALAACRPAHSTSSLEGKVQPVGAEEASLGANCYAPSKIEWNVRDSKVSNATRILMEILESGSGEVLVSDATGNSGRVQNAKGAFEAAIGQAKFFETCVIVNEKARSIEEALTINDVPDSFIINAEHLACKVKSSDFIKRFDSPRRIQLTYDEGLFSSELVLASSGSDNADNAEWRLDDCEEFINQHDGSTRLTVSDLERSVSR